MDGVQGWGCSVYFGLRGEGYDLLAWIWLFWRIGVAWPDLLMAGAVTMVVGNLIISLEWRFHPRRGWSPFSSLERSLQ